EGNRRPRIAKRDGLSADDRQRTLDQLRLRQHQHDQQRTHQKACPSEMCRTFDRSRPPVSINCVSSFQPQSTRSGPIGDRYLTPTPLEKRNSSSRMSEASLNTLPASRNHTNCMFFQYGARVSRLKIVMALPPC